MALMPSALESVGVSAGAARTRSVEMWMRLRPGSGTFMPGERAKFSKVSRLGHGKPRARAPDLMLSNTDTTGLLCVVRGTREVRARFRLAADFCFGFQWEPAAAISPQRR
jgi:hypothetical protein